MIFARSVLLVLLFVLFCSTCVQSALASEKRFAYGGRVATEIDGDLTLYEIYGAVRLPWTKRLASGWQYEPMLEASLGVLDGDGDTGGRIGTGLDLQLFSPRRVVSYSAGIGVGAMTEDEYGDVDFGGPIFFSGHIGMMYWFTEKFSFGYRYYHESNGSIYDKNPSLNMHKFEFRLHF